MNKTVKKIIIWTASIIGIGVIAYLGFVAYVIFSFSSGCGMDDGPFSAVKSTPIEITAQAEQSKLSEDGEPKR
jgi:hypothetical protein